MAKKKNRGESPARAAKPAKAKRKAAPMKSAAAPLRLQPKQAAAPRLMAEQPAAAVFPKQGQKKPDYLFWAAIGLVLVIATGALLISLSGAGSENTAPLKSAPAKKQAPQNAQPAAPSASAVSSSAYDSAYFQGNQSAQLILVEYSDFQCPYCGEALAALSEVKMRHPEIKFVYQHYPLSSHPDAQKAAEASECAGQQGKFWEMHDKLFANQNSLSVTSLKGYASEIGIGEAEFNSCLDLGKTAATVASQTAEGSALGVRATPSFLVFSKNGANPTAEAKVQKAAGALLARYSQWGLPVAAVRVQGAGLGMVFAGALPYSDFEEALQAFKQG